MKSQDTYFLSGAVIMSHNPKMFTEYSAVSQGRLRRRERQEGKSLGIGDVVASSGWMMEAAAGTCSPSLAPSFVHICIYNPRIKDLLSPDIVASSAWV